MGKLTELHFKGISESVVSQLPLEQLEKLAIYGSIATDFSNYAHRLISLKDLRLSASPSSEDKFIAPQYPILNSLIQLRLEHFTDLDLTGLSHLRHLSIMSSGVHRTRGMELIYPHLKSFCCKKTDSKLIGDKMESYRTDMTRNVLEFTYVCPSMIKHSPYPLHDNLSSFIRHLESMNFIVGSRPLRTVSLHDSSLSDYSLFSNLQMLYLKECSTLTDLTSFKNVPYLHLSALTNVKDFSCLGNQKCLKISRCEGLTDEAVSHFGNIFRLCIVDCNNIVALKGFAHNQLLFFKSNDRLKEIHLSGKDYIFVSVTINWQLTKMHLTGRVYSLEATESEKFSVESLKGNCSYVNGKEVQTSYKGQFPGHGKDISDYFRKRSYFPIFALLLSLPIVILCLFFKL
jgi:hypothetical protein